MKIYCGIMFGSEMELENWNWELEVSVENMFGVLEL